MRSVKEIQSNTALGSITFPSYKAFLLSSLAVAQVAAADAECHVLDSQGRKRGLPATTGAACPDRQYSYMVPGTGAVGFGTCPLPSILSLLGAPWLLPSQAHSLAQLGPGLSHCNDHKISSRKTPRKRTFSCLPPRIFWTGQRRSHQRYCFLASEKRER